MIWGGVNGFSWDKLNILEIGCSYGYNLAKFCESFSCQCYGIEPSKEAVEDGNRRYKDLPIQLTQGTGDLLPYEAESMDVVIMGFCMLWMERKDILQAYAQADRVLKTNGIMMVYDFDAKMPYLRDNIHNREVFTYKMDYAQPFMAFPNYYLMDKTVFCHMGNFFDKRIQERISLQILYKESLEDAYRKG